MATKWILAVTYQGAPEGVAKSLAALEVDGSWTYAIASVPSEGQTFEDRARELQIDAAGFLGEYPIENHIDL